MTLGLESDPWFMSVMILSLEERSVMDLSRSTRVITVSGYFSTSLAASPSPPPKIRTSLGFSSIDIGT